MAYKSSKSMIGKMSHSKSTPDVTHKDLIVGNCYKQGYKRLGKYINMEFINTHYMLNILIEDLNIILVMVK